MFHMVLRDTVVMDNMLAPMLCVMQRQLTSMTIITDSYLHSHTLFLKGGILDKYKPCLLFPTNGRACCWVR